MNLKVIAGTFSFVIASSVFAAEQTNEAYRALRKFQSKCEVGISYRQYREALPDLDFAVKEFIENSGNEAPNAAGFFSGALGEYKKASKVWYFYNDLGGANDYAKLMSSGMADLTRPYCTIGSTRFEESFSSETYKDAFDYCLSEIWKAAATKTSLGRAALEAETKPKKTKKK